LSFGKLSRVGLIPESGDWCLPRKKINYWGRRRSFPKSWISSIRSWREWLVVGEGWANWRPYSEAILGSMNQYTLLFSHRLIRYSILFYLKRLFW
jgi:hypothetical protein